MKRMDECPDPDDGAFAMGTHRRSGSRELGSPEPSLWDSDGDADLSPRANHREDSLPIEERHTAPSRRGAPRPGTANADAPASESSAAAPSDVPASAAPATRQPARNDTPP